MIRDMYDGLVSRLMSTMVALERGTLPAAEVLEVLRDCVDDSRMFVDSLEPMGHDLVVLLATVRHRFGPRLQAAGLNVRWEVKDVPLLPWLEARQALQVMRIVQESLTYVLKHARATGVRIATRVSADECGTQRVLIEIEDDGIGVGRCADGIGAQQLDATLAVISERGRGTKVTLALPLTSARIC